VISRIAARINGIGSDPVLSPTDDLPNRLQLPGVSEVTKAYLDSACRGTGEPRLSCLREGRTPSLGGRSTSGAGTEVPLAHGGGFGPRTASIVSHPYDPPQCSECEDELAHG
jgi:hypothetical protein